MTYFGGGPAVLPMASAPGLAGPLPSAAHYATVMRHQSAAIIQRCYHWLDRVVPNTPVLSGLAATLTTAVQLYGAQQYVDSLNQSTMVAHAINQARATSPQLPPL